MALPYQVPFSTAILPRQRWTQLLPPQGCSASAYSGSLLLQRIWKCSAKVMKRKGL